jgi:hypothetical protein
MTFPHYRASSSDLRRSFDSFIRLRGVDLARRTIKASPRRWTGSNRFNPARTHHWRRDWGKRMRPSQGEDKIRATRDFPVDYSDPPKLRPLADALRAALLQTASANGSTSTWPFSVVPGCFSGEHTRPNFSMAEPLCRRTRITCMDSVHGRRYDQ